MRDLILRVHLVIALIAGTFMAMLGVTGSVIAFEPELDRLLHRDLSFVTPGGRALSLVEIGDSVRRQFPDEPIVAFLPSVTPQFPTQVILSRGIISVNQYTGEILGVRTRGRSFLGFVRALHTRLGTGDFGKNIVRWSAVAMLVSLGSGLYLWWPTKRIGIGWSSTAFAFDLHNAVGALLLVPMLALAATGVVIGFEDEAAPLLEKLTHSSPAHDDQAFVRADLQPASMPITPDQAVAIASARAPNAVAYRVQMPRFGGLYVVALENPRDRITGGSNSVRIDPWSGRVLTESLSSGLTAREWLMAVNEAIHTGNVWRTPGRAVVAIAGIFLPVQLISGIMIWLRRRKLASSGRRSPE